MKIEVCVFSGYKIYPGHGKRYVRADSRSFVFLNGKCEASFLMKCNPRRTNWTVVYRRINRKGAAEEVAKKKSKRTKKFQRGIVGASLETIRAKRNVKPEVRQAERDAALRAFKDKKKEKQQVKKAEKEKEKEKDKKKAASDKQVKQPRGNKAQNLGGKQKPQAKSR